MYHDATTNAGSASFHPAWKRQDRQGPADGQSHRETSQESANTSTAEADSTLGEASPYR